MDKNRAILKKILLFIILTMGATYLFHYNILNDVRSGITGPIFTNTDTVYHLKINFNLKHKSRHYPLQIFTWNDVFLLNEFKKLNPDIYDSKTFNKKSPFIFFAKFINFSLIKGINAESFYFSWQFKKSQIDYNNKKLSRKYFRKAAKVFCSILLKKGIICKPDNKIITRHAKTNFYLIKKTFYKTLFAVVFSLILSLILFHKKSENQIRKKIAYLYLFFFILSFILIISLRLKEYINPEFVNYPKNDVLLYQKISIKKIGKPKKISEYHWMDIPQSTYFKWKLISKRLKKLTHNQKIKLIDEFPFSFKTGSGINFNLKNTNLFFTMSFNKKILKVLNKTHLSNDNILIQKHFKKLKKEYDISINEYIKILKAHSIALKKHNEILINFNYPSPMYDPINFAWIFYFLSLTIFGIKIFRFKN